MPDANFLAAVQAQMDRVRPIGTQVKVVPPVYVEIQAALTLRGGEDDLEERLRQDLSAWLEETGIGGVLQAGDAWALVQGLPGVLQVREVTRSTTSPGCYQNEEGDLRLPQRAIPRLGRVTLERLPQRGSSR